MQPSTITIAIINHFLPCNVQNSGLLSITSFKRALKHSYSVRIRIQRIRDNLIV